MGGYSHLSPSGHFPRSILVSFVCTCNVYNDVFVSHDNRVRAKILRVQSFSVHFVSAREFCPGESLSSEQCTSTLVFEQSSRLLSSSSRDDLSSKERTSDRASSRLLCDVVRWSS